MRRAAFVFLLVSICSCGSVDVANLDPKEFSTTGGTTTGTDCTTVAASFATDVVPIFSGRGCNASGCHTGAAPAGNLDLTASLGAPALFTNATSNSRVSTSSPSDSKLLRKPLGLDSHGGGKVYDSITDADYVTAYCWISAGAQSN
ncbi:MAG TPA: hypothetical protein VI895_05800 [Bdellovibrionota bacterium]|nr:hypothetical protein [Bdellovibrionota bacterium]